MDEKEFQTRLAKLMEQIQTLPEAERTKLEALANATQSRHVKLKKTVSDLTESLDYLRLSLKYLVFDLEATRRENGYLRKLLQNQEHGFDHDSDNDHDLGDFGAGDDTDDDGPVAG